MFSTVPVPCHGAERRAAASTEGSLQAPLLSTCLAENVWCLQALL